MFTGSCKRLSLQLKTHPETEIVSSRPWAYNLQREVLRSQAKKYDEKCPVILCLLLFVFTRVWQLGDFLGAAEVDRGPQGSRRLGVGFIFIVVCFLRFIISYYSQFVITIITNFIRSKYYFSF